MSTTFADLGVPAPIARTLADRGITEPFPIQAATIPDALAGRDLCGKAPTGSGKTIAFGIPLVAGVTRASAKRPKGLVLVPTRELALQVADELRTFSGELRVLAAYGGANIEPQIKQLRQGVDILVACPGRLLDLIDRRTCELRDVTFAVVDEADRMADMGFLPDVQRILDQTGKNRQTLLFSATLDGAIDKLVRTYQVNPVRHETIDEDPGKVSHHFWVVEREEKIALAAQVIAIAGPTVVFCRTRHGSDRLARQLGAAGVRAAAIHGARSQAQRERALQQFHRGEIQALVATDVAARGIHVEGVLCVLHADLPADPKDYVHRSGRTARAGQDGTVVALFPATQRKEAVKLRKAVGVEGEITPPDVSLLPVAEPFRAPTHGARSHREAEGSRGPKRGGSARPTRPAGDGRSSSAAGSRSDGRDGDRSRDRSAPRGSAPDRTPARDRHEQAPGEGRSSKPKDAHKSKDAAKSKDGYKPKDAARSKDAHRPKDAHKPKDARGPKDPGRRSDAASTHDARPGRDATQQTGKGGPSGRQASAGTERHRGSSGFDDGLPVADARVRPSGAARRKARREAALASGETPPPSAKRKRSGAPRPPKAARVQGGGKGKGHSSR